MNGEKIQISGGLVKRLVILCISVVAMGFATSFLRLITLGSDPYTTVNTGIDMVTPISFGTAELLVNGILLIFIALVDRRQINLGTILNMVFLGYISDFFLFLWGIIFPAGFFEQTIVRYALLIPVLAVFVLSAGGYIGAKLGVSAYDATPIYLAKKFPQISSRLIRIIWDWLFIIAGFLMGAPVGIITILMAFLLGPVIGAVGDWFHKIGLV